MLESMGSFCLSPHPSLCFCRVWQFLHPLFSFIIAFIRSFSKKEAHNVWACSERPSVLPAFEPLGAPQGWIFPGFLCVLCPWVLRLVNKRTHQGSSKYTQVTIKSWGVISSSPPYHSTPTPTPTPTPTWPLQHTLVGMAKRQPSLHLRLKFHSISESVPDCPCLCMPSWKFFKFSLRC